jgi:hypothetical protein
MHLTVYYIKFLAYEAKLVNGSLLECISWGENCFTCLEMAESAKLFFVIAPLRLADKYSIKRNKEVYRKKCCQKCRSFQRASTDLERSL